MSTITTYIYEALEELRHVRWPTRQQAVKLSIIVLSFTVACAAVFGLLDFVFSSILTFMVSL